MPANGSPQPSIPSTPGKPKKLSPHGSTSPVCSSTSSSSFKGARSTKGCVETAVALILFDLFNIQRRTLCRLSGLCEVVYQACKCRLSNRCIDSKRRAVGEEVRNRSLSGWIVRSNCSVGHPVRLGLLDRLIEPRQAETTVLPTRRLTRRPTPRGLLCSLL